MTGRGVVAGGLVVTTGFTQRGILDPGGHGHRASIPMSASVHVKGGGVGTKHCLSLDPGGHGQRGSFATKASVHLKSGGGGAHCLSFDPGGQGHRGSMLYKASVHLNTGGGGGGGGV